MHSLEEAINLRDLMLEDKRMGKSSPQVSIYRETRYFADFNGINHALVHDWTTECVDAFIDEYKRQQTNKQEIEG